jgi:transcriptional regulator with XRE-family HTH domain
MPKKEPPPDAFAALKLEILRSPMGVGMIAARAGITRATIYYWLQGTIRKPNVCTMHKVAGALGQKLTFVDGAFVLEPLGAARETQRARPRMALWRFRR